MLRRHVPSYIYNKVKTLTMFRIKKLDIFIAKQFGLLFIGTFFICQFVLMMQFLWKYVDELIGKGLSMDVLAEFSGTWVLCLCRRLCRLQYYFPRLLPSETSAKARSLQPLKPPASRSCRLSARS